MPPGYLPPTPEKIGALSAGWGIMFSCAKCRRGAAWARADLIQRWGEEGRVAAIAERFRCSNCRRKGARVELVRVRDERTEGERARAKLAPTDRLVRDIENLKPLGEVR